MKKSQENNSTQMFITVIIFIVAILALLLILNRFGVLQIDIFDLQYWSNLLS